jgi:hypothetical protein
MSNVAVEFDERAESFTFPLASDDAVRGNGRGPAPPAETDADAFPDTPPWWSSLQDGPAWAVSLGVHVLVLFILASITHLTITEQDPSITSVIEEMEPDAYKFDATVVDQVGSDSDVNQLSPSQAAATHLGPDPQKQMENRLLEEVNIKEPMTTVIPQPNEAELLADVDTTGSTEHTGGVEGAMDRLTLEIASSLRERKTLVVWLFDASLSLRDRRNAIADRFENVYQQLGAINVTTDKALKTAVATYGEKYEFLTPEPVDDIAKVVPAVRNVKPDESGKENVFAAVQASAKQWLKYRTEMRRNMMIIIVTDERGDDYQAMEDVIHWLRRFGIRVYCVGNASLFGREKGWVSWTYEDGFTEDLPVDQGPETVAMEHLQLPFWGVNGRDLDRMSSGYGPYAMTRLCAETGGLFLITEEGRGPRFEPSIMRNYQPDYRPIREYEKELQTNLAKRALVEASTRAKVEQIPQPQLAFRADTDTALRQETTEAQKPLAVLEYQLNEMLTVLTAGEKDRPKLTSPRWQASFDLAMGRALAIRARAFGYNSLLAEMKASPKTFQNKANNTWMLAPSRDITAGPSVKKLANKAEEYLTRVIDEHPGTPWQMLAERELSQPMGWQWQEASRPYEKENRDGNDARQIQLAEEEQKRREMERQKAAKRTRPSL